MLRLLFNSLYRLILLTVLLCMAACNHAQQFANRNVVKVKIQLTAENWIIEENLLNYTPVGTPADEVLEFVKGNLHHSAEGDVEFSNLNVGPLITDGGMTEDIIFKSISVHMGIHGRSTKNLMAMGNWVFVTWLFNHKNKLIDVIVVKYNPSEDYHSNYFGIGDDEWDNVDTEESDQ